MGYATQLYSIYIIALISLANTVYPIPRREKHIKSTGTHMIDVKSKNMNEANLTMSYLQQLTSKVSTLFTISSLASMYHVE